MKIAVIGGGIIGLTSAVLLQEAGHEVTVFSKNPLAEITSSVAAAVVYPYGVEDSARVFAWYRRTEEYLETLLDVPDAGVSVINWRKCAQLAETPIPDFFYRLRKARPLDPQECPAGYVKGIGAELFLMNAPVHLAYVLARFRKVGGQHKIRDVTGFEQMAEEGFDIAVNATGVYARDFTPDADVQPGRGQIVLARNPGIDYHFSSFEGRHYIYARGEECILGGSMDIGQWDRTPNDMVTEGILTWAKNFDSRFSKAEIINVLVGLRPMRSAVRIEIEEYKNGMGIIHNYGHGGAGYTLSWGCAFSVLDMVKSEISREKYA